MAITSGNDNSFSYATSKALLSGFHSFLVYFALISHGRRFRGTVPTKFEVGEGPCIRRPNILKSNVIGCEAKYLVSKRRFQEGIFSSEIEVFGQEKWSYKGHIYVVGLCQ